MADIKRIGPPTVISGRGSEYDLSVPLNATPSRVWQRAFHTPDDWKEPFHPSRITMKYRALIFTSENCRVHLWMALIDKWIASANERHALLQSGHDPTPGLTLQPCNVGLDNERVEADPQRTRNDSHPTERRL